jgi:hypothetical protein
MRSVKNVNRQDERNGDRFDQKNGNRQDEKNVRNLYQPDGSQSLSKRNRGKKGVSKAPVTQDARHNDGAAQPFRSRGPAIKIEDTSPELQRGRRSSSKPAGSKKMGKGVQLKDSSRPPRDKSFASPSRSRDSSVIGKKAVKAPSISDFDSAMDNIKRMREGTVSMSASSASSPPLKFAPSKIPLDRVDSKGVTESIDSREVVVDLPSKWGAAPLIANWGSAPSQAWKPETFKGGWGQERE